MCIGAELIRFSGVLRGVGGRHEVGNKVYWRGQEELETGDWELIIGNRYTLNMQVEFSKDK